jgi:hypothetical protein
MHGYLTSLVFFEASMPQLDQKHPVKFPWKKEKANAIAIGSSA